MAGHRLFETLTQIDPQEAECYFRAEFAFDPSSLSLCPAPIQRVAIFTESFLPKVDGVSKTAYLSIRYLQETGREVLIFAPDIAPHRLGSSTVIPMPSLSIPSAPETRITLPHWGVGAYLDDFQPDLVHLFSPALLSLSGLLAARKRGIPVIANYQTDLPNYAHHYGFDLLAYPTRELLRYIHNNSHLTLVPSTYTLQQLKGWGFRRLRRWGRGVDSQRFSPAHRSHTMRERLLNGRDSRHVLCIYVGRLANEKRVDLLLEAARLPGVALTIIGDGALRGSLEAHFAGTGTHFEGYMYGDELAQAYASADCFLFTGPCETFGQVVQEAMASGLPSVVIDQGGVVDLVEVGKTGYICPADPVAFSEAVTHLRDDPALRQRMAATARQVAGKRPWNTILNQLEGHYHEALALNQRLRSMNGDLAVAIV
jgi:phosphatidylinositol alpha 1,6-mannosyltransferase